MISLVFLHLHISWFIFYIYSLYLYNHQKIPNQTRNILNQPSLKPPLSNHHHHNFIINSLSNQIISSLENHHLTTQHLLPLYYATKCRAATSNIKKYKYKNIIINQISKTQPQLFSLQLYIYIFDFLSYRRSTETKLTFIAFIITCNQNNEQE